MLLVTISICYIYIYIYIHTHKYIVIMIIQDCTPEIDTSEVIVDFQRRFPMDVHLFVGSGV